MNDEIAVPTTIRSRALTALNRIMAQLNAGHNLNDTLQIIKSETIASGFADWMRISLASISETEFDSDSTAESELRPEIIAEAERTLQGSKDKLIRKFQSHEGADLALLATVIAYEGQTIGNIILTRDNRPFDGEDMLVGQALANLVTVAVGNHNIMSYTLDRERFYAGLGRVMLAISATVELNAVLELICAESLNLFHTDGAYIWRFVDERLLPSAARGHADARFGEIEFSVADAEDLAASIIRTGKGVFYNDLQNKSLLSLNLPDPAAIQSVLGIPLKFEEEYLGVLMLGDVTNPHRFQPEDLERVAFFGTQAAVAIKNAQLVTEMRQLNQQLDERVAQRTIALGQERDRVQYLLRVTTELSASLDQDRVLVRALELVNEVVNATHGTILLVDTSSGELIYPSAFETHKLPPLPRVYLGLEAEKGLAGWVIANRKSIIIDDMAQDERWSQGEVGKYLRSAMAIPLIAGDEVIGLLALFHEQPSLFSQQQLELVEAAARQVASALSNSQLYMLIRVQAERLGRMLREEHIESAKSQAILESIADGVLVADTNQRVVLANHSAASILDIPRESLIGKSVNELLGLYSLIGPELAVQLHRWSMDGQTDGPGEHIVEQVTIKGKIVSVNLAPVFANQEFLGTVSIFRDVTREVEVDRMKSEFVSTVSHELRTPMTSIKGYAELMLMGASGELSPAQHGHLRVISSNADRMSDLVNDLLDISRIESGKSTLDLEEVDLRNVISEVADELYRRKVLRIGKNIEMTKDVQSTLPTVSADKMRVAQILTNLLENAFLYTDSEGHVAIRAWSDGDCVRISVSDTGIGIKSEDQSKVFERFYRTDEPEVQRVPGTGLGLAIVHSLIEMHGGEIQVESTPGKGSTFTFSLPIERENA